MRCYEVMSKGDRPGTKHNKRSYGGIYSKFCKDLRFSEYPADEWQLIKYACYTAMHVMSIGMVKNYVGGVRTLQALAGYPVPPASSPNLKLVMKGLKAELARPTRQASPLSREILIEISAKVIWNSQFHVCCYSAILIGFYLCLRSSNLVPLSSAQFNPSEQLTRGQVSLDEDLELGMFDIEWSKTVQYREKDLWLAVRPASRPDICPLATLKKLFDMVPADDSALCFSYRNKSNVLKALTYGQLSEQLKKWVESMGRDPTRYMLHGMRRGSTVHAYKTGIDDTALRLLGNWQSDMYLRYVDMDMEKRVETAVKFADNM